MKDLPKDNHEGIACCASGGREAPAYEKTPFGP